MRSLIKDTTRTIALLVITFAIMGVTSGCNTKADADSVKTDGTDASTSTAAESDHAGDGDEGSRTDSITDEQAISAISNYCHANNPDLEKIERDGEYPVYWEVASRDENEIVVLFRSYTGAQIRYYINATSGDTYVTEFVPGITSEEERTDESFNIKDYYSGK